MDIWIFGHLAEPLGSAEPRLKNTALGAKGHKICYLQNKNCDDSPELRILHKGIFDNEQ